MNRRQEQSALERAVARGWLSPTDAARWSDESRPGARLERLVQRGLLRADEVAELLEETGGRDSAANQATTGVGPDDVPDELATSSRYRVERRLGAGGSGAVFLARDLELDRLVALKVLDAPAGPALRDTLSEARLQARVTHPNVCQVFDVGEIGRHPYIAMQYVDGQPLGEVASEMTTDEIVAVIRDVARAAHAAHAVGLIHRDIKPANVVVERADDGGWRAFVVDFGIARVVRGDAATITTSLSGTPAYMAPEQLGGEARRIDRRTDVYGIGATLYEALAGEPPFSGDTAEVLAEIRDRIPLPLRRHDRAVPADLETVALVCLEKDPARRYPSAAALADDLDRYLAGDPIEARRPGLARRVGRAIARRKAVAALAALLIASLAGAAIWGVVERRDARRQAERARDFAREAAAIDVQLRLAHLAPLHDTRRAREDVRARMARIAETARGLDGPARAAADLALGAGHLALGEIDDARATLERAWQSGERGPEAAWLLGRALAAAHRREVAAVRAATGDNRATRARLAALDAELADPARRMLARAGGAWDASPELIDGLMKLESGDFDGAIAAARTSATRPWQHQAKVLEARADLRRGIALQSTGDLAAAVAALARAREAYAAAAAIARSDPDVHAEACTAGRWLYDVEILLLAERPADGDLATALEACDRALTANPGALAVHAEKANIEILRARVARARGDDPRPHYHAAAEAGQRAADDPDASAEVLAVVGEAHARRAIDEARYGDDPRPPWDAAIAAYLRTLARDPDAAIAHTGLAIVSRSRAAYALRRTGGDPLPWLERAIVHGERAVALSPEAFEPHNNLCRIYTLRGNVALASGGDAAIWADRAEAAIGRGLEIDPDDGPMLNNRGNAVYLRAEASAAIGQDPRPDLERALDWYRKTLEATPGYAFGHGNIGGVHLLAARYELAAGLDPSGSVDAAIAAFSRALELRPGYGRAHSGIAGSHLISAARALAVGRAPTAALDRARAALAEARRIGGGTEIARREADLALIEARFRHQRGRPAAAVLARAEAALAGATRETAPADHFVALADIRLRRAAWAGGGDAALAAGLEAADKALARNPRDADALAVKAALLRRRGAADEAAALLESARARNPLVDARQLGRPQRSP